MFMPMQFSPEHEKFVDEAITAAFKKFGVSGAAAEILRTQLVERSYIHSETGEVTINVAHPHIPDEKHDGWNGFEWLNGQPRPTALVTALRLLLDATGPEAVLARRRRQARVELWRGEWSNVEDRRKRVEQAEKDKREEAILDAWRAQPREQRALAHLAAKIGGNTPFTIEQWQEVVRDEPAAHLSTPPAGWIPPPPEASKKLKTFGETFRNLTVASRKLGHNAIGQPIADDETPSKTIRPRGIGEAKLEITTSTIVDASDDGE